MFRNREALSFNFGQSEKISNLGLSLRYRTKGEIFGFFQKIFFADSESTRKMRDKVFKKCDKKISPPPLPPSIGLRPKRVHLLHPLCARGFFFWWGGDYLNFILRPATLPPPIGLRPKRVKIIVLTKCLIASVASE